EPENSGQVEEFATRKDLVARLMAPERGLGATLRVRETYRDGGRDCVREYSLMRDGAPVVVDPETGDIQPYSPDKSTQTPIRAVAFDSDGKPLRPTKEYVDRLAARCDELKGLLGLDAADWSEDTLQDQRAKAE